MNKANKFMMTLVIFVSFLITDKSFACAAASRQYLYDHEKMIQESDDIYLAKAIRKRLIDKNIVTNFEVIEVVKGKDKKFLAISFSGFEYEPKASVQFMSDFSLHTDEIFWRKGVGRSQVLTQCETVASFRLGYVYLLFPDFISNSKGVEIVNDTSDKWFRFVKNKQ